MDPEAAAAGTIRGARAVWILGALVLGLLLGAMAARMGDGLREPALKAATIVGGLWLDALKMTVIPLIFALLVTGIAKGTEAAWARPVTLRVSCGRVSSSVFPSPAPLRQLIVTQLDYDLTPVAGLALVGHYLAALQGPSSFSVESNNHNG